MTALESPPGEGAIGYDGRVSRFFRRKAALAIAPLPVVAIAALFVPEPDAEVAGLAEAAPFAWGQDALWARLEGDYDRARAGGCEAAPIEAAERTLDRHLEALEGAPLAPDDEAFRGAERALFELAPRAAACPAHAPAFAARVERLRQRVKSQSRAWDVNARPARETLYRLLYGGRAALEEVILQAPDDSVPALSPGVDEPSATPSVTLHGVTLHSGDVLLSRGGAPTSAFIARGNDFPGNFSHVALLHVAEDGTPTVIESHIESGVGTSTAARYLEDTKLRIAVLRVRADHPALRADPMLPHRAASDALRDARARRIAYDFAMDWRDPSTLFCSEVASAAYAPHGVRLWQGLSSMSGPGLTRWLAAFGVRHFITLAPSDLEYDPQLSVVAEWRDPATLHADHLDNAALDAMLERAEAGDEVRYRALHLPVARLLKAYSVVLNLFGRPGPIPEGMSATTGLRVDWLRARHGAIRAELEAEADAYGRERGRRAPYWVLARLAREAERTTRP